MTEKDEDLALFINHVKAALEEAKAAGNIRDIARLTFGIEVHTKIWDMIQTNNGAAALDAAEGVAQAMMTTLVAVSRAISMKPAPTTMHLLSTMLDHYAELLISHGDRLHSDKSPRKCSS